MPAPREPGPETRALTGRSAHGRPTDCGAAGGSPSEAAGHAPPRTGHTVHVATVRRNSNPALNESAFQRVTDADASWAAQTQALEDAYAAPAARPPGYAAGDVMTVGGTVSATAALLVLVVATGVYGWNSVDATSESVSLPGWLLPVVLGGLGVAILTIFKPDLARFTAPLYALLQGAFLGAISAAYNTTYDGIVVQAVGLTIGVFAVMLFLYGTRIIKVTDKLRMGIVAATGAIFLIYM